MKRQPHGSRFCAEKASDFNKSPQLSTSDAQQGKYQSKNRSFQRSSPRPRIWFGTGGPEVQILSPDQYRGPISHGKLWITFDDFGSQLWCLAFTPHGCSELDPIIERAAVRLIGSIDRAFDADKLSLQITVAYADHCIPVSARIDK